MNDLEDRLTAALRAEAERAGDFSRVIGASHAQGVQLRRRRRLTIGLAGAGVLAATVPVGILAVRKQGSDGGGSSTDQQYVRPRPSQPVMRRVAIELAKLPEGPAPASSEMPWHSTTAGRARASGI